MYSGKLNLDKSLFTVEQRLVMNLLIMFVFIYPFIINHSNLGEVIDFYDSDLMFTILSLLLFCSALLIFVVRKKNFSLSLLALGLISIIIALINLQFSLMAVPKIFLNWIAFTFITIIIAQSIISFSRAEMVLFQKKCITAFNFIIIIQTILLVVVWSFERWYLDPELFMYYTFDDQNQIFRILRNYIGIDKQYYGNFLLFVVAFIVTHWKLMSVKMKAVTLFFILINLPMAPGVRTLVLALLMGGSWFYFLKNGQRKLFAGLIALQIIFLIFYYQEEVLLIVSVLYDRLPSVQFAWTAMTEHFFGLGIGAYHIYVREHNDRILEVFGSETMLDTEVFWDAPESDIVYFIASWGVLAIFFLVLFIKIAFSSTKIFHGYENVLPIEKAFLINTTCLIFMGISQDNAGQLYWWLMIAVAIGVILRHERMENKS